MERILNGKTTLVVLDDDPTGIQTVHSNLLLTRWNHNTLTKALEDKIPFFYLLTNTRSLSAQAASGLIRTVVEAVLVANQNLGRRLIFISRSDSTLRSHFPLEIDQITSVLEKCSGISIDASFMVPAFFEGGRQTIENVHFLLVGNDLIPTDQTEFARDHVFGYSTSRLPDYIHEKTDGRVDAESVRSVSLEMLRQWHPPRLSAWLGDLVDNQWVVVNAENYTDLDRFCVAVRSMLDEGKQFVFQSAASLVKSLTRTPTKALLGSEILRRPGPGLVVVGSYVHKTTEQLWKLLSRRYTAGVELDVGRILDSPELQFDRVLADVKAAVKEDLTPVVYTNRQEITFPTSLERLTAGQKISAFLSRVVKQSPFRPSFVVAKGGITSHDVLVDGLEIAAARVGGQILPGVPVIFLPKDHPWGTIPYVIFPGNVGEPEDLAAALDKLELSTLHRAKKGGK